MKTIALQPESEPSSAAAEAAEIIRSGGLVCLPCAGRYRIVADLEDVDAVTRLLQAKSRIRTAPTLVFIEGSASIDRVADELDPLARKLADAFWPGPLTIRVRPSEELPSRVVKQLGGKKSRIGVRVPADPLLRELARVAETPLLVSSANRERKAGDGSPAQVRKTFGRHADLFIDSGELSSGVRSTVIDVVNGEVVVEREGVIDAAALQSAAG